VPASRERPVWGRQRTICDSCRFDRLVCLRAGNVCRRSACEETVAPGVGQAPCRLSVRSLAADRRGAAGWTERLPTFLTATEALQSGRVSALPKMPVQFRLFHAPVKCIRRPRRSRCLLSTARFRAGGEPRAEAIGAHENTWARPQAMRVGANPRSFRAAAADVSTRILMTKSGAGSCSEGAVFESVEHAWLGSEWPAIRIGGGAKGIARDTPLTATARRNWERGAKMRVRGRVETARISGEQDEMMAPCCGGLLYVLVCTSVLGFNDGAMRGAPVPWRLQTLELPRS
jgi:hypothetical protein